MPKVLKITLSKSIIAEVPKNVRTVNALGLRKVGQTTMNEPTSSIKGMIHQVKHLLTVEEVDHEGALPRKRRYPHLKKKGDAAVAEVAAKPAKAEKAPKAAVKESKPAKAAAAPKATAEAEKPKRTTKKKEVSE